MLKVAINGFGRIGRTALRLLQKEKNIEVVAINDLTDPVQLAYLYKYDSVHRTIGYKVDFNKDSLIVKGKKIKLTLKKVKNATGYEIQYATNKKFKKAKTKKVKKLKVTLKKLKKKKKYFIRVRAFNKTTKGAWSKVKKVKVKK